MTNRTGISLLALALLVAPLSARGAPATIKVFEAEVHAAPDPASPVIHTFAEGTRVSVSEDVVDGFRKVRLPDGKVGFVEESAISLAPRRPAPPRAQAPAYAPPPPPGYVPPPPTYVPPPPPRPPPYYRARYHDPTAFRHVGFFLRFDLGLGYLGSATSPSATGLTFDAAHGVAGEMGLAIGGAVKENLILAGHFWGTSAPSPTLRSRGTSFSTGDDFSVSLFGIGPSIDYYFMPQNVYVSVTPSLTWVRLPDLRAGGTAFIDHWDSFDTAVGFGTRLAVGKEWWVSGHFAIGLAGWFAFSFNQESSGFGPTWRTFAGGLGFSGTFN